MDGSRLWEHVSNPLARQLLQGVFDVVPFKESLQRDQDYLSLPAQEVLAYRKRLRERLERSGIACALAAGIDLLPDLYPILPQPLRAVELLFRPRSYRQLGALVVRYLDWYVQPEPKLSSELTEPRLRAIFSIGFGFLSLAAVPLFGAVAFLGFGVALLFFAASYLTSGINRTALMEMNAVRVAELLFYLIDSYSDVEASPEDLLVTLINDTEWSARHRHTHRIRGNA